MNEHDAKTKLSVTVRERILLLIALAIAVFLDRLVFSDLGEGDFFFEAMGIFWLCYMSLFGVFYWDKIKHDKVCWYLAVCAAALCIWNFVFYDGNKTYTGNMPYRIITFLLIPTILMLHAQMVGGRFMPKEIGRIVTAWLLGWFIKPFSGISALFRAIESLSAGDSRNDKVKKVVFGVLLALLLLVIILPLLSGADQVFGYYLNQIFGNLRISSFIGHSIVILIAFALFYSFIWNVEFGENLVPIGKANYSIDKIIGGIILATVSVVYVIFCAIQFTYLFAGAGLPEGMTYSSYAREGFAQTVLVCAINLLIFGVFLRYRNEDETDFNIIKQLLAGLLALTGVMLFSGVVRLSLYIEAYGLTWLRLLSGWFIIYLAVVIILCAVRMYFVKIPLIAICVMILIGWYIILGYANPDGVVDWYNLRNGYDRVERVYF